MRRQYSEMINANNSSAATSTAVIIDNEEHRQIEEAQAIQTSTTYNLHIEQTQVAQIASTITSLEAQRDKLFGTPTPTP